MKKFYTFITFLLLTSFVKAENIITTEERIYNLNQLLNKIQNKKESVKIVPKEDVSKILNKIEDEKQKRTEDKGIPCEDSSNTIQHAINIALKNNPKILVSKMAYEASKELYNQASSANQPRLDFVETYRKQKESAFGALASAPGMSDNPNFSNTSLTRIVRLSQNILNLPVNLRKQQAQKFIEAEKQNYEKTVQEVVINVIQNYYNVLKAIKIVEIAKQSLKQTEKHLALANIRFNAGTSVKSDVLRTEVELSKSKERLIRAENGLQLSNASLMNSMGLDLQTEYPLCGEPKFKKFTYFYEDCLKEAISNRPEILAQNCLIEAQKLAIQEKKANYYPTVSMQGNYNWRGIEYPLDDYGWDYTVNLNFNVFDGGLKKSQLKEQTLKKNQAQASFEVLKQAIELDVKQNYYNLNESYQRIEVIESTKAQAEENYRIVQLRYEAGVVPLIDVLDAEISLTSTRIDFINALFDLFTANAKLIKSMGIITKEIQNF